MKVCQTPFRWSSRFSLLLEAFAFSKILLHVEARQRPLREELHVPPRSHVSGSASLPVWLLLCFDLWTSSCVEGANVISSPTSPALWSTLEHIRRKTWWGRFMKAAPRASAPKTHSRVYWWTWVSLEKNKKTSTLYYKRTQIEQFSSNDSKSDFSERCGPPDNVSFRRLGGRIAVKVTWNPDEMKWINHFNVTYRAQGSPGWSKVSPFTPPCLYLPPL